jgi:hypothetical protein
MVRKDDGHTVIVYPIPLTNSVLDRFRSQLLQKQH